MTSAFTLLDADTEATSQTTTHPARTAVVNSFNEWDALEEVIVGFLPGAAVPPLHFAYEASIPDEAVPFFQSRGGTRFEPEELRLASEELDEFARVLEAEGIVVKRPDAIDHSRPFQTPNWRVDGVLYSAMPRDLLIVFGDEIIEA